MTDVLQILSEQRVIAIVRAPDERTGVTRTRTLLQAGLRIVEVSLVTPGALDAISAARATAGEGTAVGVGTALTPSHVHDAVAAGAQFVVAPNLSRDVLRACADAGVASFPGIATPTEAVSAISWGATGVKVFPASLWSPAVLRDVLTALPDLRTVPTGGVGLDEAAGWIAAGAFAVGVGSTLTRSSDPAATAAALLSSLATAR